MNPPLCKDCETNERAAGRTRCFSCYGRFRRGTPKPCFIQPSPMRTVFLDIETSPNVVYTWGFWKTNIGVNQVIQPGEILCFSAKWFGDDGTMFFDGRDDHVQMIAEAWRILDEADVIIHYYGSEFDVKWLNQEFLQNGFPPPSPFKQIDLKKVVSRSFNFPSNKLQYVTTQLELAGKVEHEGFPLWVKCLEGEDEAWARMEEYNRQDVELLMELYEIVLPWITGHPHRHLYGPEQSGCPTCGHETLDEAGFAYTRVSRFRQYRCSSCGAFFRDKRRVAGVEVQESVL